MQIKFVLQFAGIHDFITQMWALMLNALRGNGRYPTFFFQPMLPKLPVPNLNLTLDR